MDKNTIIENVFYYKNEMLYAENKPLMDIVEEYASPTVVFSKRRIEDNILSIKKAFSKYYPKTKLFFATKACYLPGIINTIRKNGVGADVSSSYEYKIAKKCGVSDSNIVWNSPAKNVDEMRTIVENKCLCNVDSLDEIISLNEIARQHNTCVNVGLRLNPGLKTTDSHIKRGGKLGIDVTSGQAMEACRIIKKLDHINLIGLHCHVSVQSVDTLNHVKALKALVAFAELLYDEIGIKVEYLCPGGGFQNRTMMESFGGNIEIFAQDMYRIIKTMRYSPILMIEPGRYIVDDTAVCIGKIICKKKCWENNWWITDMGTNYLMPFDGREYDVKPIFIRDSKKEYVEIGDRTSSYLGVIIHNVLIEELEKNDLIAAFNCGSYTFSCSQNFIYPLCYNFVMVDDISVKLLLKSKEEEFFIESIFSNY